MIVLKIIILKYDNIENNSIEILKEKYNSIYWTKNYNNIGISRWCLRCWTERN